MATDADDDTYTQLCSNTQKSDRIILDTKEYLGEYGRKKTAIY